MATLEELEEANNDAALRGDPALLYALLDWARRTKDGLGEPEIAECRERAQVLLADRASKGALSEIKGAMGANAKRPEGGGEEA